MYVFMYVQRNAPNWNQLNFNSNVAFKRQTKSLARVVLFYEIIPIDPKLSNLNTQTEISTYQFSYRSALRKGHVRNSTGETTPAMLYLLTPRPLHSNTNLTHPTDGYYFLLLHHLNINIIHCRIIIQNIRNIDMRIFIRHWLTKLEIEYKLWQSLKELNWVLIII